MRLRFQVNRATPGHVTVGVFEAKLADGNPNLGSLTFGIEDWRDAFGEPREGQRLEVWVEPTVNTLLGGRVGVDG